MLVLLKSVRLDPDFLDFMPHDAQAAFMLSDASEAILWGGNQLGKTEAITVLALYWATGEYPTWWTGEKLSTPNRGRIFGPNLKDWVAEILEPKLRRWLPTSYIQSWKTNPQTKGVDQIVFKNGSVIDIVTYSQDQAAAESWTGNWAIFDEPSPRETYVGTWRGLAALNGKARMSCTLLSEPWIQDILDSCKTSKVFGSKTYWEGVQEIDLGNGIKHPTKTHSVFAIIDDNLRKINWLGVMTGGMNEAGLAAFVARLKPDEIETRRYGRPRYLQGAIYKEFDDNIHIMDDEKISTEGTLYCVVDPHDAKPHAVSWFRVDPMNNKFVVLSLAIDGNLNDLANQIKQVEECNGWSVTVRLLDPNKGRTPTAVSRRTWQEELAERGLWFETDINDDIAFGHQLVKNLLSYDKTKPLDDKNHPKLYFARRGAELMIFSLRKYTYDTNLNKEKHDPFKEKPKDKFKDFPDTLRYAVVYGLEYREPFDDGVELYNPDNFSQPRTI